MNKCKINSRQICLLLINYKIQILSCEKFGFQKIAKYWGKAPAIASAEKSHPKRTCFHGRC